MTVTVKLIPLGSTTTEVQVGAVWHTAAVTKFDDLLTHEITAGVTSYADDIGQQSVLMKVVAGAKLKLVSGYTNGSDITKAMEKGEVDSEFGWSWGAIKTSARDWIEQKKINIIIQFGAEKSPELPDVPFITDYAKTDLDRHALELLMAPDAFAWPFIAPPGVPADRIALLREAFDATMTDPSFVADAKQVSLEINPMSGESNAGQYRAYTRLRLDGNRARQGTGESAELIIIEEMRLSCPATEDGDLGAKQSDRDMFAERLTSRAGMTFRVAPGLTKMQTTVKST